MRLHHKLDIRVSEFAAEAGRSGRVLFASAVPFQLLLRARRGDPSLFLLFFFVQSRVVPHLCQSRVSVAVTRVQGNDIIRGIRFCR